MWKKSNDYMRALIWIAFNVYIVYTIYTHIIMLVNENYNLFQLHRLCERCEICKKMNSNTWHGALTHGRWGVYWYATQSPTEPAKTGVAGLSFFFFFYSFFLPFLLLHISSDGNSFLKFSWYEFTCQCNTHIILTNCSIHLSRKKSIKSCRPLNIRNVNYLNTCP